MIKISASIYACEHYQHWKVISPITTLLTEHIHGGPEVTAHMQPFNNSRKYQYFFFICLATYLSG